MKTKNTHFAKDQSVLTKNLLLAVFLSIGISAFAYKHTGNNGTGKTAPAPAEIMAGCAPATSFTDLDINNTRARLNTGGDMFWDLKDLPKYEIPKGSKRTAMFAGALWMGGKDVSGQLKVAAQRYRGNGNDYWTGPLSTVNAEISPETCLQYDKHFVTTRDEVAEFVAWFDAGLYDAENGTSTQQDDFPNYQIPNSILEWPAHGRNFEPFNEDFYLAPFKDRNGDGIYNPYDGDYPAYILSETIECTVGKIDRIYGDQNLWWIFNDKGNVHTETGSNSIGMEIRAQAFAFATNDEVNNMTFYNYELVNRSTYTLTETYFSQWVDADLGCANDDLVGCDVRRGLGYCYNGDEMDEDCLGAFGYGEQPPAIGVDFFQGPYQDNDDFDNPLTTNYAQATNEKGIPYKGIGIGYGDGVKDNERFGMRKFLWHNNCGGSPWCDPTTGPEYYNIMRSYWRDNSRMVYGGNGHINNCPGNGPASGTFTCVPADYMFPDDTDPYGWGTGGDPQPPWNEINSGNTPGDRRLMQAAGPFTLGPGATNNITVGIVWARATTGGAWASVQEVRIADDKTQAMFDNCFRLLNGPDAPEVSFREMDKELIMYVSNKSTSNNYNEAYKESDYSLVAPDSIDPEGDGVYYMLTQEEKEQWSNYKFQGYQIFQVKDNTVAASDLKDPDRARLIYQCDLKDGVSKIVNYYFDSESGANVPVVEVVGEDKGIRHSFQIIEDKFSTGTDKKLVNHKKYYFMVIAYAYNYSPYNMFDPINDPDGSPKQKKPYLPSRKATVGGIKVFSGIPHKNQMENWGTVINSKYGDGVEITRIEGQGNGGNAIYMKQESIDEAAEKGRVLNPVYERGKGPVNIKVVDPLNVIGADFYIKMLDSLTHAQFKDDDQKYDSSGYWWFMWEKDKYSDGVYSTKSITVEDEQIIPQWGLSVSLKQAPNPRTSGDAPTEYQNDLIEANITFADENKQWLAGISDEEGICNPLNWIRSGTATYTDDTLTDDCNEADYSDYLLVDDEQVYESILDGTLAPFRLCAAKETQNKFPTHGPAPNNTTLLVQNLFEHLQSVDIVITDDKTKWTRCPVLEMNNDPAAIPAIPGNPSYFGVIYSGTSKPTQTKGYIKNMPSVDKNGNPADIAAGADTAGTDPNLPNFISNRGMGWFPGYVICTETGERLNMAFGEFTSSIIAENGNDMLWNPTSNIVQGPFEQARMGGSHYIFVFRNNVVEEDYSAGSSPTKDPKYRMPAYDDGRFMYSTLRLAGTNLLAKEFRAVYRSAMWVGLPLLASGHDLHETDVTISIRVSRAFEPYGTGTYLNPTDALTVGEYYVVDKGPVMHDGATYTRGQAFKATSTSFTATDTTNGDTLANLITTVNAGRPMYSFSTWDLAAVKDSQAVMEDALKLINVVPNPYFAYSEYETDKIDNRIKIINLPRKCNISIYTTNGTLVRKFSKDDPTITSVEWDLKNHARVPIASGMYIIHVHVPDLPDGKNERVLKWMGIMRPIDLDSF